MDMIEELGISPAPWSENKWQSPDDYGHDVQDAHRNLICEMFLMQGGSRGPNARLIAAAPKLYKALYDIVCYVEGQGSDMSERVLITQARQALAEARGEEVPSDE